MIFSSPFARTRDTSNIVAEVLEINKENILIDDRLHEMSVPMYEGQSWNEYHKDFPTTPESFYKEEEGNESYNDIKKRTMSFIYDMESKYSGKNILIVTHGGPTWLVMAGVNGFNAEESLKMGNDFDYFDNAEWRKLDFVPLPHNHNYELDLHRPYIDSIILVDEKGEEYKRVPEVIDCWFESGSMPFAQDHFPFENKDWKEKNFPSGFVAEYIAQTRTWFYYTHAISSILFGQAPFENVVTTGTILAEDGQKMSKSKNNFPNPLIIADKYGVDALRFYLLSSPLLKGEDINFSEKGVGDVASKIIGRFDNVLNFYELYRDREVEDKVFEVKDNILDRWIKARLLQTIEEVNNGLDAYDLIQATRPFDLFIEDLSTWYLRRSRDRIKDGDKEAKHTLYFVLRFTSYLFAPIMPFIAEDTWQKLKVSSDVESIHLTDFFDGIEVNGIDYEILKEMKEARDIVTLGFEARQKAGIKVRQPLTTLKVFKVKKLSNEYIEILKDELNIKNIEFTEGEEKKVELDTYITEELKQEGHFRALVRAIQDMRKKNGLNPNDFVGIEIETGVDGQELINTFMDGLLKSVGAKEIKIKENTGVVVVIDDLSFNINISLWS